MTDKTLSAFRRVGLKRKRELVVSKRQKFVISVALLTFGLFFFERRLDSSAIMFSIALAFLTDAFLLISNYKEIKENFFPHLFILPFFYSLSFALFYFLVPARLLTRVSITFLYALGLYSLFLSQNIFIVGATRTIALLSSARIVSFILAVISYFFLSNVIISLDLPLIFTSLLIFLISFSLVMHSFWIYTLDKINTFQVNIVFFISLCLSEISLILWFWPASPIFAALFLTGFFYTIVGLLHVWIQKRLFRGVLWEYVWVAVIVFLILILSTSWKG